MNGYAMIDHDSEALEDLLALKKPTDHDKVQLGAISKRYPYPHPLGILAQDIAEGWGLTLAQLDAECRTIWASGFRPGQTRFGVGSANDTPIPESIIAKGLL